MDHVEKKSNKKILVGIVTSDKMDKTVVVAVEGRVLHPLYKKYITRTKKYKAHDAENQASLGDRVQIQECRPVSKDKRFRLICVLEKAR
jgi:small subunit ribosomal protein S17